MGLQWLGADSALQAGLVSVIVPTYNRAQLASEAVECLRRQTYTDIQTIVVDDGSTDETREKFEHQPDVIYIRQQNSGPAAARNAGLKYATGEFLCTIDSDDIWCPSFLHDSLSALRQLKADLVFSNWIRQNENGSLVKSYFETNFEWWKYSQTELPNWRKIEPAVIRKTLLETCIAPTSAWVFRRELIRDGWPESLRITDDWGLLQDIFLTKPYVVAVNTTRSWVKRVQKDNVCDSDGTHVRRAIEVDTPYRLLSAKAKLLSSKEKARLHRKIAIALLSMSNDVANDGQYPKLLTEAVTGAFLNAPVEFVQKFFRRAQFKLPVVTETVCKNEGLCEELSCCLNRCMVEN